jgi:diacylglycerol kinase family enzyme
VRVRLVVNPRATGVGEGVIDAVTTRLVAVGELEVCRTERPGHAVELAAAPGADAVVAMGGDGTYNEVVNGLPAGVRLGVLPAGASSVFARQLGFATDPVVAAGQLARALAANSTRPLGLGRMDGRRFTFAASLGLDAATMRAVDRERITRPGNRRPGDLRVVAAAVRELAAQGFALRERMTLEAPGRPPERASYVLVANQHPYTYFGRLAVQAAPRASFDSGLDAVAVGELRARGLWRLAVYALVWPRHAAGRSHRVGYLHDLRRFSVRCDAPTPAQLDGEYVGDVEGAEFAYEEAAMRVYVPPAGGPAASRRRRPLSFRAPWSN